MVKEGAWERVGMVKEWWDGKEGVWERGGMGKEWWDDKRRGVEEGLDSKGMGEW